MAREAFVRARRFLEFQRRYLWAALITGVLLGVVFLGFLCLAGLFADLFVSQGRLGAAYAPQFRQWLQANIANPNQQQTLTRCYENGQGLGLVSMAVRTAGTWYGPAVTAFARHQEWTWTPFSYLTGLVALVVFLGLVHFSLALLMNHWAVQAVLDAAYRLRRAVYLHSLRLSRLTLHDLGNEGLSFFTRDLEAVQEGLFHWLTVTFKEPARFLLVLAFALVVDSAGGGIPWITLTTVVLATLVWLIGGWIGSYYRQEEKQETTAAAEQMALMREALSITRLVKGFGMDAFNQNRMERQLFRYGTHLHSRLMTKVRSRLAMQILAVLALATMLYATGWCLITDQVSWPQVVTLLIALVSLYPPLQRLLQRQKVMEQARRSAANVFRFLDMEGDLKQVVGAEFLAPMTTSLEFDQVTLKEKGQETPLLDRVSFRINAGERVSFISENERSLRSVAYLIARFIDPTSGEIRIDGRRLPWMTLESIRAQVGLVLQDDLIFGDSVLNNLACGDAGFTLPKVIEAAKAAHAHQFIQNLPMGYETAIGEIGEPLNAGQKYRLALARVILRDPALVILEEPPYNSMDEATRSLVDDAVNRFLVGRTAIFLPHRPSTIMASNRVYLLSDGRVEAVGSHRELILKSERYRHLQYLEFNVFAEDS